jgi:hypothetical protein
MGTVDENIAILRNRFRARVTALRADLELWVEGHSGPPCDDPRDNFPAGYSEISAALLETAIDHHIRLHDATDALDLVTSCSGRQVEKHRRSLQ